MNTASFRATRVLPVILGSILAGCTTYHPLPVDEANIVERLNKNSITIGLPVANTPEQAIADTWTYAQWYAQKSAELRQSHYRYADAGLGFNLAGLAAGFAGHAQAAASGSLLANLLGWPDNRYQIGVQAGNYEKAADAMSCLHRQLSPLTRAGKQASLPEADVINTRIAEVRTRLRKVQAAVTPATPDTKQLEAALRTLLTRANTRSAIPRGDRESVAEAQQTLAAELDKCVATFSQ